MVDKKKEKINHEPREQQLPEEHERPAEGNRGDDLLHHCGDLCDHEETMPVIKEEEKELGAGATPADLQLSEQQENNIVVDYPAEISQDVSQRGHVSQGMYADEEHFARLLAIPVMSDEVPENVDHKKMNKRYQAIPEEFYSKSGLRPIKPSNFWAWFKRA